MGGKTTSRTFCSWIMRLTALERVCDQARELAASGALIHTRELPSSGLAICAAPRATRSSASRSRLCSRAAGCVGEQTAVAARAASIARAVGTSSMTGDRRAERAAL